MHLPRHGCGAWPHGDIYLTRQTWVRDKAQPGHGTWVLSMGTEVRGPCLVMELLFRGPGLHQWSLSEQPLDLCHCRFLTLKPQGFQLWALLEELCQLSEAGSGAEDKLCS